MTQGTSGINKIRIMILGPTAAGKTDLAHHLALETGGEIISVDSRQCFKRIDIGTAKPAQSMLEEVSYHNISILELTESDSAAEFQTRAEKWNNEIKAKNKTVIYAGGSTLHLQSLIQSLDELPSSNRDNIRLLEETADKKGLQALFEKLTQADPDYAEAMDGLNRQRIIRALDVWMQTGKPFSSFHTRGTPEPSDDLLVFGLHRPRKILHERINRRVDRMIENGLVEETEQILADGYSPSLQSLQTVGYRDVISYLKRDVSREQMIADIKTQTRRYAKKQITWFRKWPFIRWMNAEKMTFREMLEQIQEFQNKT